jgi:hypothetical protein
LLLFPQTHSQQDDYCCFKNTTPSPVETIAEEEIREQDNVIQEIEVHFVLLWSSE